MDTKEPIVHAEAPDPAAARLRKKRKSRKVIKRIIAIIIVLAIIGGLAYGAFRLFGTKDEQEKEIMEGWVYTGSIQSMVTGSGVTKPKDSTTITLTAAGTVSEVYVSEGDFVNEGDLLYVIDSAEAVQAVEKERETIAGYNKQIDDITASYADLTVTAPYSGKLLDVSSFTTGDTIGGGSRIATLVDDSSMLISLYFSYAYKGSISVGQAASVTVPSSMTTLSGKVTEICYVDYISPEGGNFFEVTISVSNPGTLTEGTGATAELTAADSTPIYPYDYSEFTYSRKTEIIAKLGGEVCAVNLKNHLRVSAGSVLLRVSEENNDNEIAAIRENITAAEERLAAAEARLNDFSATAPMSGTVLSCSLIPGEEVGMGTAAISIADTTTMTIEAQIDEMNITYVKPGMYVDVSQYGRDGMQMYSGTVVSVSMEGKYENGVSYFPAVISVDNYDGTLMSGMYVDYSMLASQSDYCLLVPVQAVKYTALGTCLFVKYDSRPDNALETEELGIEVPEGYYAIPVTVGLSDNTNAEITGAVQEGDTVFVQYMTNSGSSYGGW